MICPYCQKDNIDGVDTCEHCDESLTNLDPTGGPLEETITTETIEGLKPKTPISISGSTTVREAVDELVGRKIGSLLVLDDTGNLSGIFTERDLLTKASDSPAQLDQPVTDFMTVDPVTITMEETVAYALHAMKQGGYRHLPVVDDAGKPIGMISIRDVMTYLYENFATPTA